MGKWGQRLLAGGLICAMTVIIVWGIQRTVRRTTHITLPAPDSGAAWENSRGDTAAVQVKVTPETVRAAVGVMARPTAYCRTLTITRYWNGGKAESSARIAVSAPWTRVDRTAEDGTVRHSVTNGEITYIWYNDEAKYFSAPSGGITADDEQQIPTYEDVLALFPERIAAADYRTLGQANCIYVETAEEDGYQERWWIGTDTGLLTAAERLYQGEIFYRMDGRTIEEERPSAASFTLPDGTVLLPVA